MKRIVLLLWVGCSACTAPPPRTSGQQDSARSAFARVVDSLLLDTQVHEIRGLIMVKVPNPVLGDESPLVDQAFRHTAAPGPHTMNGTLYAEIGALRALLGDGVPVKIQDDRAFVGAPEVLVLGHKHDDALFVPVKLFARQYGAFVDISCTLANCGFIWPRPLIEHMKHLGMTGGTGMLEGHAEGIVDGINVRKLPTG